MCISQIIGELSRNFVAKKGIWKKTNEREEQEGTLEAIMIDN